MDSNTQKKRIWVAFGIFLILFSGLVQDISHARGAEFDICLDDAGQNPEDPDSQPHQAMYHYWGCLETAFKKYVVQDIVENSTHIEVKLGEYIGENETSFPAQPNNNVSYLLNGNISEDLVSEVTYLSAIIPLTTDFRNADPDLMPLLMSIAGSTAEKLEYSFLPSDTGYSFKVNVYYKVVIWIKAMSLNAYYSTTGILLRVRYEYIDPDTMQKCNGGIDILPEYTTFPGADQDPLNPVDPNDQENNETNTDQGSGDENESQTDPLDNLEGDTNIKWDAPTIAGFSVGGAALVGIIAFLLRKKFG